MAEFDYKEYARQMRENAVKDSDGVIRCSPELWEQIASIVENIPTADVAEVKHGEWLLKYIGVGHCWECSECEFKNAVMPRTNYCPNCGADMRGDENEV